MERRELEREQEDLLERSVKKEKENAIEDATMDEEMLEKGPNSSGVEAEGGSFVKVRMQESNLGRQLVSYKDMVLQLNGEEDEGDSDEDSWTEVQRREDEEEDEMGIEEAMVQRDPLCPVYLFSAKEHREDCKRWRNALIIKLMGKRISNWFLMARLFRLWALVGKVEVIDLDNGYIMVNFHENRDYDHVLYEGPWVVIGHYVTTQRWRPMFNPLDDQFKKMAVWIRIPDLPLEFYTSRHL